MKLKLEPLERSDFSKIQDWIDPAIFHVFTAPLDEKQMEKLLSEEHNGVQNELGMRAIDRDNGELVGIIHAVFDLDNDLMHIQQMIVDPNRRGQGYGQEILRQFIDHCLSDYSLHRIQLFTEENNKIAISCYKKAGLRVDGILRDRVKTSEGYLSTYIFSVLDHEWEKMHPKKLNSSSTNG